MSENRSANLQDFLDALKAAFSSSKESGPEVLAFLTNLFAALDSQAPRGKLAAAQPSVCEHLPAAFQFARSASPEVTSVASSLEKIAPLLAWKVRPSGGPHASANWPGGHANAVIVGNGGLEERSDIAIGVSLLAPHVRYPDHTHAPEELYLVLSPGRFQHGDSEWFEPGPGGTLHNVPNIRHAMASDEKPLLAIWCLLLHGRSKI